MHRLRAMVTREAHKLHKAEAALNAVVLTAVTTGLHGIEGPVAGVLAVVYLAILFIDDGAA